MTHRDEDRWSQPPEAAPIEPETLPPPADTPPGQPIIEPLVVRRSTMRTWLASLAAIPFVVFGVDVIWRRRIVGWLTERIFPGEAQLLEPRDTIWAWAMVIVGGAVVAWGLKELFFPAPVLVTGDDGIHIRMLGPFRRPTTLPWDSLFDIDAGTLEDDGEKLEVLVIEVKEATLLPLNPWGGRRFDDTTLALFSTEWDVRAEEVAQTVADQALVVARHAPPPR